MVDFFLILLFPVSLSEEELKEVEIVTVTTDMAGGERYSLSASLLHRVFISPIITVGPSLNRSYPRRNPHTFSLNAPKG